MLSGQRVLVHILWKCLCLFLQSSPHPDTCSFFLCCSKCNTCTLNTNIGRSEGMNRFVYQCIYVFIPRFHWISHHLTMHLLIYNYCLLSFNSLKVHPFYFPFGGFPQLPTDAWEGNVIFNSFSPSVHHSAFNTQRSSLCLQNPAFIALPSKPSVHYTAFKTQRS